MNKIDRGTHLRQGSTFLEYMRFNIASLKKKNPILLKNLECVCLILFNICPNISLFYENS